VLACGIFGNIPNDAIRNTILTLPRLCAPGATVIWTRGRTPGSDILALIDGWFAEACFAPARLDAPENATYSVGSHCLTGEPLPFERGLRLFEAFSR